LEEKYLSISLAEALSYLDAFREVIIDRDIPAAIKGMQFI
jgi:hypothetical protein